MFACLGRDFVGNVNLSASVSEFDFSTLRLGTSLPEASTEGFVCLGAVGLDGNPAENSNLFCRSVTTDFRIFSEGTGPDELICGPPEDLGFIGSTGGTARGGEGFDSLIAGSNFTKFSGNKPRFPFNSPSNQPSSKIFIGHTQN